MKRLLFGIMLSIVGLSYSLICFHGIVSNPWICNSGEGLLSAFLETGTLLPYLLSSGLLLLGILLTLMEAYGRK